MPTTTFKNISEPLYERLKHAAETHRRSLNSEILACMRAATFSFSRNNESGGAEGNRGASCRLQRARLQVIVWTFYGRARQRMAAAAFGRVAESALP